MTKRLYEVSAKGELLPESSGNSTCKTWKLLTALYTATSAKDAEAQFKESYTGEYTQLLPFTTVVPEGSPIHKQYMEDNGGVIQ